MNKLAHIAQDLYAISRKIHALAYEVEEMARDEWTEPGAYVPQPQEDC